MFSIRKVSYCTAFFHCLCVFFCLFIIVLFFFFTKGTGCSLANICRYFYCPRSQDFFPRFFSFSSSLMGNFDIIRAPFTRSHPNLSDFGFICAPQIRPHAPHHGDRTSAYRNRGPLDQRSAVSVLVSDWPRAFRLYSGS